MIEGKRVLALIPARGGSKGLPQKNMRILAGRPLVAWPVAAARAASCVDRVIVSTDDPAIAEAARAAGADIPFMRPPELASDAASSMSVVQHALDTLEARGDTYDYVILLEPTSPLTESRDIDGALRKLHAARERADSIVGIAAMQSSHPAYAIRRNEGDLISPSAAPHFGLLPRRQELEDLYYLEGSLYASAVPAFRERNTFYHERTLGYEVPRWKSFEIDELVDFICVEALLRHKDDLTADAGSAR